MKSSVVMLAVPSELLAEHLYWPISSISTLWICREPFFRREYLSPSTEPSGSSLLLQNKHWTLHSSSEIGAHGKGLCWNDYRCSVDKAESNVAYFFFFLHDFQNWPKVFERKLFKEEKSINMSAKGGSPGENRHFKKAIDLAVSILNILSLFPSLNSLDPIGSAVQSFTHNPRKTLPKILLHLTKC